MSDLAGFVAFESQRRLRPLVWGAELERLPAQPSAPSRSLADGGLGPLGPLLEDPAVGEIMINGPGPVWVERHGHLAQSDVVLNANTIAVLIDRIVGPLGLRVDRLAPIVDGRLPDGSRVSIVVPPITGADPVVTIRCFTPQVLGLDRFGPPSLVATLEALVAARATMVVVGPTSSGKTSLLNSLISACSPHERLVCIEDTAELALSGPNRVRLEARPPNSEGVGGVTVGQLVKAALRMRPDRLVVGEVRGGEAFDLLLALSSGHAGSLATCHASGALPAIDRLEALASLGHASLSPTTARQFILQAVDAIVVVGRAKGQRRGVSEIRMIDTRGEAGVGHPGRIVWRAEPCT